MAKVYDSISAELQQFIAAQHIFFVATAPLTETGHINLSPKGLDSFRILSPRRVAYLDLTGSGNETSAHLQENGRVTLMFCAFQGKPLILRLYGRGRVILPNSGEWAEVRSPFPDLPGVRQVMVVEVERVQTSCGTGVPLYDYRSQREELVHWAQTKGTPGLQQYWQQKNQISIDGAVTPLGHWISDSPYSEGRGSNPPESGGVPG